MNARLLFFTIFLISGLLRAQEVDLSGTVKEAETGIPIPGANVIVKNTTMGTSTDFDGNFFLAGVPKGAILQISYIGFRTQELTVGDATVLNIELVTDTQALDEVVVVGYGTQTKKELTGAVTAIDAESIEAVNPQRVEQALQGQVAGVQVTTTSGSPGAASNIRIRGISTNGDNRPLILVDGNVIEDLSVLNPGDIESMTVLKDATAGIYGVRAANGVILITTKTGKLNTELKFSYDAYGGFQETSRKLPVLNATEYAVISNEAAIAGGDPIPFPNIRNLGQGTDWQDEVFEKAPIFNHNLTMTGGTEKSRYSFGVSYLTQDGIVGGDKSNFNRTTVRANYNLDPIENLKLTTNILYTGTNRRTLPENALGSVLFNALNNAPTFAPRNPDGTFTYADGLGQEIINPLAQMANTYNKTAVDRISGKVGARYEFLDGFSAESSLQFNYAEVDGKFFEPIVFYGVGKTFNRTNNSVFENFDIYKDYTWDSFINYDKDFGDHNVKATLGMSVFRTQGDLGGFRGNRLPTNNWLEASIDVAEEVEDVYRNGGDRFDERLLSYFARAQYNYKNKYLFSALIRRDGSTKFGPENRFGYFPSGSVGWVVSEEDFFGEGSTVTFLKLRGSYGIVGNDRIPANAFRSVLNGEGEYVFSGPSVTGDFNDESLELGAAAGILANPQIQWEEQKTLDIGMDMRMFDSRLSLTADYFKKTTENLLVSPPVSGILGAAAPGAGLPIVNAGTVENEGFEFVLGWSDDPSEDFSYNISYNMTFLRNEVLSVNNGVGFIPGGGFGVGQDFPSRMEDGKPLGYFYGYETDGVFQTQAEVDAHATQPNAAPGELRFVDTNGDGVIDETDRTDIGNPIPDATLGFNLGFNYKNFDFSAYTFGSIGNEIVRNYERAIPRVNRLNYVLNRWTGPGSTNTDPRVTTGATSSILFSDYYVEDGSFIRIQNVQLGYTINPDTMDSVGLDSLRFYVSVNNLYTFTEYRGYDPSASSGAPIGGGIDQGFYPVPRTYLLGLNLKF
ncbi:SusC/RagA family TonB-linked outer membrane protein [Robertkochia sediminum]|uniref:SusC/RagA family TonB-linked outer membrane protein n=1 Tax=Robertkochia sediminum TaxID=2785326 RepID=UPI001934155E|nr:TonB-dependent receptor [Robertkochia sediminum]MBL7473976.1 TonB-dependent receptor [Robertkochia sediminum]